MIRCCTPVDQCNISPRLLTNKCAKLADIDVNLSDIDVNLFNLKDKDVMRKKSRIQSFNAKTNSI